MVAPIEAYTINTKSFIIREYKVNTYYHIIWFLVGLCTQVVCTSDSPITSKRKSVSQSAMLYIWRFFSSYCPTLIYSASVPSLWKNSSVLPQGMVFTQAPPSPGEHLARPATVCVSTRLGVDDAVVYLLHRSLEHLENTGSTVRVMFVWTATWLHEPSTTSPTVRNMWNFMSVGLI